MIDIFSFRNRAKYNRYSHRRLRRSVPSGTHRVHIYTLLSSIPLYTYVLLITLLQNALFSPESLWEHITSYALSISLIGAAAAYSVMNYISQRYNSFNDCTFIQKGFPIKKRILIPYEKMQSVIMQRGPVSSLFSSVKVQLNTPATAAKKGDASFYLSKERARKLLEEIYSDIGSLVYSYKARNLKIFFMAAVWSNPVSGLLIVMPFINNIGKLLGEGLSDALMESFDLSAYLMYVGLPPVTAAVVYALAMCYGVSVAADFTRNASFSCCAYQNGIVIERGFAQKTFFLTNSKKLNAVTVSQSVLMAPFGLYSAYIHTSGAGKTKGDKSLLVAAERKDGLLAAMRGLLSGFRADCSYSVRPRSSALKSYLSVPFMLLTADIIVSGYLEYIGMPTEILFTAMLLGIPWTVLWCVFRMWAFYRTRVSFDGRYVLISGCKRFKLTQTVVPVGRVQLCVIRRNAFQKLRGTCTVRVYIYGEKRTYAQIKHIPAADARNITDNIYRAMV